MDFTTNTTPKNVDNITYNITTIVRNNYYGYNSNKNTIC